MKKAGGVESAGSEVRNQAMNDPNPAEDVTDSADQPQDFDPVLSRIIDHAESMMQRAAASDMPTVAEASEELRDAAIGRIP
jgi:hypothetical protein